MTTQDFITKTYNTASDNDRQCSSVFTDRKGTVYSYGYHYPLAFNVAGLDFVNDSGYSSTTSKHICWAWRAVPSGAIGVPLWRPEAQVISSSYDSDHGKLQAILTALKRKRDTLATERDSKKRTDTWVYSSLQHQIDILNTSINTVREAL